GGERRVAGGGDEGGNDVGKQLLVAERVVTLKHVRSLDRHRRLECRRSGKLGAAPSPLLRGEGWGEGDSPDIQLVESPPHPLASLPASPPHPGQAGGAGTHAGRPARPS